MRFTDSPGDVPDTVAADGPATLSGLLHQRALADPGGPAMITEDGSEISSGEIYARARAVAAYLGERADPGDRVLIACPPGLSFLSAFWGAMLARLIPVPVPPPLGRLVERHDAIAADCRPRLVLADGIWAQLPARDGLDVVDAGAVPDRPGALLPGPAPVPDDTAFLQYTSGTTGTPKGAIISHRAALAGVRMTGALMRLGPGDRTASWLPWFHDLGLLAGVLLPLHCGHAVLVTEPLDFIADPAGWLQKACRTGARSVAVPQFAFRHLLDRIPAGQRGELAGLPRWWASGAEVASPDDLDAFTAGFAAAGLPAGGVWGTYGMAEAVGAVSCEVPGGGNAVIRASAAELARGRVVLSRRGIRLSGAGSPPPGARVRIQCLDGSGPARPGEIGEVLVAGPHLADGYWTGPSPYTESDGHRWLRTGDLGGRLPAGLFITGRAADLITLGAGENRRLYFPPLLERAAARAAGGAVRARTVAAFQDGGGAVLAAEARPGADLAAAAAAVRDAIWQEHGIALADVVLTGRHQVPVTTSGKVRRGDVAAAYRAGTLRSLARPAAA
jgi:acyl-CoA synthetase (AMP-forming)/AMP-acid ligase II